MDCYSKQGRLFEHFREAVVKSVHDGGIVMSALFGDRQIKVAFFEVIAILEDIGIFLKRAGTTIPPS